MRAMFVGYKPFPLEMLKEDECFPWSNEDISNILSSLKRTKPNKPLVVCVMKYSDRAWNVDRWQKLGWNIKTVTFS